MKICASCQAVNGQEANFCSLCRAPFERTSKSAYCPKGHAMHPSWPECLECKGERSQVQDFGSVPPRMPTIVEPGTPSARGATILENFPEPQPPIAIPIPPPAPPTPVPTPTRAAEGPRGTAPFGTADAPAVSRRLTQYVPASAAPAAPAASHPAASAPRAATPEVRSGRKIVGLLLTYTWRPEGQIFPIREGRNLIGRNPDCEIAIPEDPHLSDTNSHIVYRGNFMIGDRVSMSGTDLNGVPVEDNFVKLPNYSQIRTGSTHFTFIAAEPPSTNNPPGQD
jgi:hypothetical protein